jgi:hypothetical protein
MDQRSEPHKSIRRGVVLGIGVIAGILDTAVIVLAFLLVVTT